MPVAASDAVVLDANVGAIVGGVVGAVALLLLSAGAFVMWKRRPAKPNSTLAVPQAKPDSAPLTKSDNAVPYAEPV